MWIYVTWIFWLGIHAAWYLWLLLVGGSVPLWICFLQSWRGDPGVITATHEDKLNVLFVTFMAYSSRFVYLELIVFISEKVYTKIINISIFADDY